MLRARMICLMTLLLFTNAIAQDTRIVADSSSKTYWAFDCVEARLVPMRSTVNFKTGAEAEANGYRKADKCSTTASRGAVYDTGGPNSMKTHELRRLSAPLELIRDEIQKWRNKTVRVIGNLSISDVYLGEFGRLENKYYSFRLSSTAGGSGYFYMAKNTTSDAIRERMMDPDLLYVDCQVRILGVASQYKTIDSRDLGGDLLSCKFWTQNDEDQ